MMKAETAVKEKKRWTNLSHLKYVLKRGLIGHAKGPRLTLLVVGTKYGRITTFSSQIHLLSQCIEIEGLRLRDFKHFTFQF